jgi:ABC-type multidrug transport system permease subunit
MFILVIYVILITLVIYLLIGFMFAISFIVKGVNKIDEGAHGSGWGFKLIIIPGTIVFWPVLLKKWIQQNKSEMSKKEG